MDEMALIIDASGSTRRWWDYFGGHLNKVLETVKPSKLHVVYTTISVDRVDTLTEDEFPVEIGIDKTGGTHMPAGVEYVEDNLPNVCCMIVLTDGETDWGNPASVPVLWAITQKHITAPHGETIHVIKEEDEL
jgi:predicted metal-dependent peptidase